MAEPKGHKAIAVGPNADQPDQVLEHPSSSAIAFKILPGRKLGEAQALLEGFLDQVEKMLEDPKWEGLEMCEHGEESMRAFTHAAVAQRQVAEALAAKKARNN